MLQLGKTPYSLRRDFSKSNGPKDNEPSAPLNRAPAVPTDLSAAEQVRVGKNYLN